MLRFLNWKSITLLVTVLSIVVPVWIWRADLKSHSLQFRIASQVSLQPDNANSISGLQVSIDGKHLNSPHITVLELSNDGDKPIAASDFESPLEVRSSEGVTIARAEVTSTTPKDIQAKIGWGAQSVTLQPLLLNPNDTLTISVITAGGRPKFSTRARIAGISTVPIENPDQKPANSKIVVFLFVSSLLLLACSDITSGSWISRTPIPLRRRSQVLIALSTTATGAIAFYALLELLEVKGGWDAVWRFGAMMAAASLFGSIWNWDAKKIVDNGSKDT